MLRTLAATRYVTPLREGGSLPAIVEADDDGLYVVKFRGAGQGSRALVAEVLAGEIGRALGLPVPTLALVTLDAGHRPDGAGRGDPRSAQGERGPEPRGRLPAGSARVRSGRVHRRRPRSSPRTSSGSTRWCSTWTAPRRNPNLLEWHRRLYCIDHGASLYVHHDWAEASARAASSFSAGARTTCCSRWPGDVRAAGERLRPKLSGSLFRRLADAVPDAWLPEDPHARRRACAATRVRRVAVRRLENAELFEEEANRARALRV